MMEEIQRRYLEALGIEQTEYNSVRLPNASSLLIDDPLLDDEPRRRYRPPRPRKPTTTPPLPKYLQISPEDSARRIAAYHKDAERRCLADYVNDTHRPGYYCPCLPTEFRK